MQPQIETNQINHSPNSKASIELEIGGLLQPDALKGDQIGVWLGFTFTLLFTSGRPSFLVASWSCGGVALGLKAS